MAERSTTDRRAATVLELAAARGARGALPMSTVLWVLAASRLVVPAAADAPERPGAFQPVLLQREGQAFVPVFAHQDLLAASGITSGGFIEAPGGAFMSQVPAGTGLAVNLGSSGGFELPAAQLATFVAELTGTR